MVELENAATLAVPTCKLHEATGVPKKDPALRRAELEGGVPGFRSDGDVIARRAIGGEGGLG